MNSNKRKILILCTGNSCRSQMAEALINARFGEDWQAFSAGTQPAGYVHPKAVQVLAEAGIEHQGRSKSTDEFRETTFDLVVTVCDHAKESCPMFPKKVGIVHIGFEDPDGKDFTAFVETYEAIKNELVPQVKEKLCGKNS